MVNSVECFGEIYKDSMCTLSSIDSICPLMYRLKQLGLAGVFLFETVLIRVQFATGFKKHWHLSVNDSFHNLHNKACETNGTIVARRVFVIFSWIGVTFAIVQSLGRMPAAIDLLNSHESGSAIHSAPLFSSQPGSWSGPLDFVTLILRSSSCTSLGVNVIASSDPEFLSLCKRHAASSRLRVSSSVYTDWK